MRAQFHRFLAIALLLASACKPAPESQSETQSLDNFVDQAQDGTTRDNVCGVPSGSLDRLPRHVRRIAKSDLVDAKGAMRKEVLGTLAAVPAALIAPLVLSQGRIVVMSSADAAAQACAGTMSDEEKKLARGKAVTTCWTDKPVRIVLPPDAKLIRHGLLRAVSYFYTEFFVARASVGEAPFDSDKWKKELAGFRDVRDGLMEAFLVDTELQDPGAVGKMRSALTSTQLADFIYAEALDSYYCSRSRDPGTPRAIFKTRFPATWKIFTDRSNPNSPVSLFGGK